MVLIHTKYEERFDGVLLPHNVTVVVGKDKKGKPGGENGEPKS